MKPEAPKERDPKGGDTDNVLSDIVGVIVIALCFILIVVLNKAEASEHCEEWALQAEGIMTVRQENVPIEILLTRLNKTEHLPEEAKPTVHKIMTVAYDIPVFDKIKDKLQVIEDFADAIFINCLKETAVEL